MIDPEAQLRRLAEGRADQVEAFSPRAIDTDTATDTGAGTDSLAGVSVLAPRRWPLAVAAAVLAVVAVGAGVFALGAATEPVGDEESADGAPVSGDDGDDGLEGFDALEGFDVPDSADALDGATMLETTSTVLGDVSIPDVVGNGADEASAALREAGVDVEFEVLFVAPGDDRVGEVIEVIPGDVTTAEGQVFQLVVARLAPTLRSTDPCGRPAHLLGHFDDDLVLDRVYPRFADGRIVEVELCTAAGLRTTVSGLDLHRLDLVADIDLDGRDDLVASDDVDGTRSRILSLVGDELVLVPGALSFGAIDGDGASTWWGCTTFSFGGADRLGVGTLDQRADGTVEWRITETFIRDGELIEGTATTGEGLGGPPGTPRCRARVVAEPSAPDGCLIAEPEVAPIGDVDGDGIDDLVSPRDGIVCLGNGTVVPLGELADRAGTWFLDDVDGDGALELFIGETTATSMHVRPYSISTDGTVTAVAEEDCCVQTVPGAAAGDTSDQVARWFSCVDGVGPEGVAELVSGRFWIDDGDDGDDGTTTGRVRWTIDVGTDASPDVTYEMALADPRATDAWIPGNGCRNNSTAWHPPATIEFEDDGRATEASIIAFNESLEGDDPSRRLVRLRTALRVADGISEADGPYREDATEGFFELAGLPDDSAAAIRWDFAFSEDGRSLVDLTRSWACQPGRGHDDFRTEACT